VRKKDLPTDSRQETAQTDHGRGVRVMIKVKVKVTLEQATKAQRGRVVVVVV
jgi:hypothetical protein